MTVYKHVYVHKSYRYKSISSVCVVWRILVLSLDEKRTFEYYTIEIRDNKIQSKYPESVLVDYSQEYL